MKKIIMMMISASVLSACSSPYSSTGENLYLKSHNASLIVVPPPLTASNISTFYVLPNQTENAVVSVIPPTNG